MRMTPFRKQVLSIFENANTTLSSQEIEEQLGDFDRVTLYRTLKTFESNGIIHEIVVGANKKFGLCLHNNCSGEEHHHEHIHFECENCAAIHCMEVDHIPEYSFPNFTIKKVEVQVSGVCPDCQ